MLGGLGGGRANNPVRAGTGKRKMNTRTPRGAEMFLPEDPRDRSDLRTLRDAAAGCRGCDLYCDAMTEYS